MGKQEKPKRDEGIDNDKPDLPASSNKKDKPETKEKSDNLDIFEMDLTPQALARMKQKYPDDYRAYVKKAARKRRSLLEARLAGRDRRKYPADTLRAVKLELQAIGKGRWEPGWRPPRGLRTAERKAFESVVEQT